jgi:hypothetical protein
MIGYIYLIGLVLVPVFFGLWNNKKRWVKRKDLNEIGCVMLLLWLLWPLVIVVYIGYKVFKYIGNLCCPE